MPQLDAGDGARSHPASAERIPIGVADLTFRHAFGPDLTPAEAAQVIELLRRAYNGGPAWFDLVDEPLDHFAWKVRETPFTTRVELIEQANSIVGFNWSIWRRFLVGGREHVMVDGGELAFDPSLQGRGMFSALVRVWNTLPPTSGILCYFGVTTHPAVRTAEQALVSGYFPFGNNVRLLVRPLDVRRMVAGSAELSVQGGSRTSMALAARARKLPRPLILRRLAWRLRMLAHRARHRPEHAGPRAWTIRTIDRFDESIDSLFERAAAAFDVIQVRDATYLNWRFCDPRGGPFVVRLAEEQGRPLGYAVLLATPNRAVIADLLVLPDRLDVARGLVSDALDHFRSRGAPSVAVRTVERHPYNEVFLRAGFQPRKASAVLGCYPEAPDAAAYDVLRNPRARVHFMYADTDHI